LTSRRPRQSIANAHLHLGVVASALSAANLPNQTKLAMNAPINFTQIRQTLESLNSKERIRWAVQRLNGNVVLLSSMQRTAVVLMHQFGEVGPDNEVLFVDTGYHFTETLRMRDEYMRRYRLNLVTLYPSQTIEAQENQYGKKLFNSAEGQPDCCYLRKELPLLNYLKTKRAPIVVGGLRRADGGRRANLQVFGPDPRINGYQLSPLFDWTDADVDAYIARHRLPIHPLYAERYMSIGCYPCTTPVQPGEDLRAGRWRHLRVVGSEDGPQYCNINFSDGAGI
jgi:phosphoadenosine phosphosulfate reductase